MTYKLTSNPDRVVCVDTGESIPVGHRLWEGYKAWLDEGNIPLPVPPPYEPYTPEHFKAIRGHAWEWMKQEVTARRYDSIESCCSYANSGVARYKAEALAMIAWRDDVNQMLEMLVVTRPPGLETWEQVQPLLPQPEAYAWPDVVELPLDELPPVTMSPE